MMECSILAVGSITHVSSSAEMSSASGALPFLSRQIVFLTSANVGSSVSMLSSEIVLGALSSSIGDCVGRMVESLFMMFSPVRKGYCKTWGAQAVIKSAVGSVHGLSAEFFDGTICGTKIISNEALFYLISETVVINLTVAIGYGVKLSFELIAFFVISTLASLCLFR